MKNSLSVAFIVSLVWNALKNALIGNLTSPASVPTLGFGITNMHMVFMKNVMIKISKSRSEGDKRDFKEELFFH